MDGGPAPADVLSRCRFPAAGSAVDCAFSGGADSTALVVLAVAAGCRVTAVHVDHGLRASSGDEAAAARHLAEIVGVPFVLRRLDLADGPNLEARARAARAAALPPGALTGHTADDRAETLLINLLRGSGLDGLTAMGPIPTRPILTLRRAETAGLCRRLGLATVTDPSNDDPRFVRARVRTELVPLLDSIAGRDVTPVLARSAAVLGADRDLLDVLAADLDPTDARAIAAAPAPLASRALRRWLVSDGYRPGVATIQRVLAVARGDAVACELAGGRRVERHRQRLRMRNHGPVASGGGMPTTEAS